MKNVQKTNVAGVVTDNTSANKKAWEILEKEFPDRFFYGCAAHGLNLLVKDIFYPKKSVKNNPSTLANKVPMYPLNNPFDVQVSASYKSLKNNPRVLKMRRV